MSDMRGKDLKSAWLYRLATGSGTLQAFKRVLLIACDQVCSLAYSQPRSECCSP